MTTCKRRNLGAKLRVLAFAWLAAGPLAALPGDRANAQDLKTPSPSPRLTSNTALIQLGTTYSRAQAAAWLDAKRFVVGRWDGTLTVFRLRSSETEFGPVVIEALTAPSRKGIEMVARLGAGQFVSSNDARSLVWWQQTEKGFSPLPLPFAPEYGMATSAIRVDRNDQDLLLVGHQQGYVTLWSLGDQGASPSQPTTVPKPRFLRAVSVRSDDPIAWQWQTWHVRGLAACGLGRVVSVAEDGDICLLEVPSGKVLSRRRYSATARRGLNDVAVLGRLVAVVNCAVGSDDNNLWIFRIAGNSLKLVAGEKLISEQTRDQVFTFSVELFEFDGQPHFVASTEEGLIWLGMVKDHKIVILNQAKVAVEGGVVLALTPKNKTVLSVGHKIQTFAIGPRPVKNTTIQP